MDIEKMTDAIRCIQTSINNDTCDIMDIDMLDNIGKALELQQQEIERLKGENLDMRNSLKSIHDTDLPLIDKLADLARVHRFTLLRKDLERLLELPEEPEEDIKDQIEQDKATREALDRYVLKKDRVPKDKFQSEDSTKRFFKPK